MNTKYTKALALAGLMGLASLADAAQYVYITGSTAGRAAVYATIMDGATVFDAAPTFAGQGSTTTADGCSYMNFHGNIGGTETYVKCHWSGSEAGISDVASSATGTFLTDSATTKLDGTTPDATSTGNVVDLCAADNNKTFSKNNSTAITGLKVAVIPFKWVKESGSAASLTALTDSTIRQALAGNAKLSLFTGNGADTTRVFVSGRDDNSGTRVNTFGDCGFGIRSAPVQVTVNSSGVITASGSGSTSPATPGGYSSGGSLATQMGYSLTNALSVDPVSLGGDGTSHFSVIAYVGMSDAASAVTAGGTEISTLNGVPFSIANIEQGTYNFWGNYYIFKRNSPTSQAGTVYNKLTAAAGIPNHADDTVLIKLTSMVAQRAGPTTDPYR